MDKKLLHKKQNKSTLFATSFCCIKIFCIKIVCVTNICTFIFDSKEITPPKEMRKILRPKNVDAKFLVAKKTHAKINRQRYLTI